MNPVLDKLGRLHEFRSQGKYDVLFESGPEAVRYHKSVVESLGVQNFEELYGIVQDVIDDIEAGRSADIDCMDEVTAFLSELYNMGVTHDKDFNQPDAHIKEAAPKFYSAYVQTVRDNDHY